LVKVSLLLYIAFQWRIFKHLTNTSWSSTSQKSSVVAKYFGNVDNNTAKVKRQGLSLALFVSMCPSLILNSYFTFWYRLRKKPPNNPYSLNITIFSCLTTIGIEHWTLTSVNYFKNTFIFTVVENSSNDDCFAPCSTELGLNSDQIPWITQVTCWPEVL